MTPTDQGAGADTGPGPELLWQATFPPDATAVRRCRQEAARALRDAGVRPATIDDAITILGELAGNAARHAGTEFEVVVTASEGILRLEVSDLDTRPPALLGLDAESTSGRGLHLVAQIASDWGWQTAENDDGVSGKRVWAQLSLGTGLDPG